MNANALLWVLFALVCVGLASATAALALRNRSGAALKAGAVLGLLLLLPAAPTVAQTADELVERAKHNAEKATSSAQALADATKGKDERFNEEVKSLAAGRQLKLKEGFSMLEGTDFAPAAESMEQAQDDQAKSGGMVYVAVSFSMPPDDLRRIGREAHKAGVEVVIRGLVNGSFKETLLAAKRVFDEDSVGGVAIDPNVFRSFDIKSVPTFISATAAVQPCGRGLDCVSPAPPNDRVSGNISLGEALRILSEQGENASDAAAAARARLEG